MQIISELDKRFILKESTLLDAGMGVFANENIKKGDILEIVGVLVATGSTADLCTAYAKEYKIYANENKTHKIIPLGFGAMVNHTDDLTKQNVELTILSKKRNKVNYNSGQIAYVFMRDVNEGEELLGNYHADISKYIEHNTKDSENIEWQRFLEFDLYHLKDIIKGLI